jgi:hypothetical protein
MPAAAEHAKNSKTPFLESIGEAILGWGWVAWVWILYFLVSLTLIVLALSAAVDLTPESVSISLGLLGVLIFIISAISAVREDHDDSLMPSWLMRLVYSFCFLATLILSISYLMSRDPGKLGVVIAGATSAFAVGALLGFIFGVPRALAGSGRAPVSGGEPTYAPNTNLERVSEWLTGIVIGLTLVQFQEIKSHFKLSATEFADSIGHEQIFFASALLIFFGIAGFLLGYLWTRLRLLSDLTRADDFLRREPEYLEGLMHAVLYTSPPRGFQRAISYGVEYCKRFGTPNSRVLLYLACAYGQQHKYVKSLEARKQVNDLGVNESQAEEKAKIAIRECLDHDISLLKLLKSLWDPNDDELADNDLESLYDVPEVQALFAEYELKASKADEVAAKKAKEGTE